MYADPSKPPTASPRQRTLHLVVNAVIFGFVYQACNIATQRSNAVDHIATQWDAHIPFIPWMILPYMSSGVLLLWAFWSCWQPQALRALSQRLLLATVVAGTVFALFPLQFSGTRPTVETPIFAHFFAALNLLDRPYNQCPSLHVAYAFILWPALCQNLRSYLERTTLALCLVLVVSSTVFTYQHHLLDVFGGAILGLLCVHTVPDNRATPWVSFYYWVAALTALVGGLTVFPLWLGLYLAACFGGVARAYAFDDAHFLHKHKGQFPWYIWLLYAPYLAGYWITWQLVRLRERHHPPFEAADTRLYVGRRLSAPEVNLLPVGCVVIDLANELSETPRLRQARYQTFAMLDLQPIPPAQLQTILRTLQTELAAGHCVYLHCAMGYSRSREVARAYLAQNPSHKLYS